MSTLSQRPDSPSEILALCFLRFGNSLQEFWNRLKEAFPDLSKVPQLGIISREYFPHADTSGLCDWAVFDLRTGGVLHDAIADAYGRLGGRYTFLRGTSVSGVAVAQEPTPTAGTDVSLSEVDLAKESAEFCLGELLRERDRQKLLVALDKASDKVSSGKLHPEEALEKLVEETSSLKTKRVFEDWAKQVSAAKTQLEVAAARGIELKTGLADLDGKYAFRRNNLLVVGAPTSHGKTAFNIRCVTIPALKSGLKVCYVCFEDFHVFPLKFASAMYDVPLQHLTRYELATPEQRKVADDALELSKGYGKKLLLLPDTKVSDLESVVQKEKPDVLIMDYLQKYVEAFYDESSKREACGQTTSRFQDLARKYGCYAVLSSQVRRREFAKMNKESMSGILRRPSLSDLKESGDIENYADSVLLLWWPWRDISEDQSLTYDKARYMMQIAKDKLGPGGDIECRFHGETLLFKDKYNVT